MGANRFGNRFSITSFGESHGPAMGVVVDGCPAGIRFDEALLASELKRRRPGRHGSEASLVSDREEEDHPEILSGVFDGKTLGTPIAVVIRNRDMRPEDYISKKNFPRPGHADDVWLSKFGHADLRGGGRSSGRETVSRVIGGAIARMLLKKLSPKTRVAAFTRQIGPIQLTGDNPAPEKSKKVQRLLLDAKASGKSYGGVAEIWVKNPPADLGQPVFHKLKSELTAALMGVGAAISVELGAGSEAAAAEGTEFHRRRDSARYGGIRGGISTGEPIVLRVGFKPPASVLDVAKTGRHDPCIVPRAVPVLEAMTNLVLADHLLWARTDRA